MKGKVMKMRQDFKNRVDGNTRCGSGRIVDQHFDTLKLIWGGSPGVDRVQDGVTTTGLLEDVDEETEQSHQPLEDSDSDLPTEAPIQPDLDHPNDDEVGEGVGTKRKVCSTKKFVDNKREKLEI